MPFLSSPQNWALYEFSFFFSFGINTQLFLLGHITVESLNVGLLKNKICTTNFISFLDRVGSLVGKGNATAEPCLGFRKTCLTCFTMSSWEDEDKGI